MINSKVCTKSSTFVSMNDVQQLVLQRQLQRHCTTIVSKNSSTSLISSLSSLSKEGMKRQNDLLSVLLLLHKKHNKISLKSRSVSTTRTQSKFTVPLQVSKTNIMLQSKWRKEIFTKYSSNPILLVQTIIAGIIIGSIIPIVSSMNNNNINNNSNTTTSILATTAIETDTTTGSTTSTSDTTTGATSTSTSTSTNHNTTTDTTSSVNLVIPTFEALVRVVRLVRTASLMAMDYKLYEWFNIVPASSVVPGLERKSVPMTEQVVEVSTDTTAGNTGNSNSHTSETTIKSNDNHITEEKEKKEEQNENVEKDILIVLQKKQKELQERLIEQQKDLIIAQDVYSRDDKDVLSSRENSDYIKEKSFQQRIDNKRHEKYAMEIAATAVATTQYELDNLWNDYNSDNDNNNNNNGQSKNNLNNNNSTNNNPISRVHTKAAQRLLELCQKNRGAYIKIGQHLANFDYILPDEYINILQLLYNENPIMSADDVIAIIQEDLGIHPNDIFINFNPSQPIASASLAQVHTAYLKQTQQQQEQGQQQQQQQIEQEQKQSLQKLAIKVQHRGLRETSVGDIYSLKCAVRVAEYLFPDFHLGWILDELAPNLPRELNFIIEGQNSERAANNLIAVGLQDHCIIPKVVWQYTSSRVLTMHYEGGYKATDIQQLTETCNLNLYDIAKLINKVFASQLYLSGFVHSDLHPANVLVRCHPTNPSKPQIVLLDHGLYRSISDTFRIQYSTLWKNIMIADIDGIRESCASLGLGDGTFALFTAILTARPFDEIIDRSKNKGSGPIVLSSSKNKNSTTTNSKSSSSSSTSKTDDAVDLIILRSYAQRFLPKIIQLLDNMPREMILLLKTGDCLRHINHTLLGSASFYSASSLLINGRYAVRALYENQHQSQQQQPSPENNNTNCTSNKKKKSIMLSSFQNTWSLLTTKTFSEIINHFWIWLDYMKVIARIQIQEIGLSLLEKQRHLK